MAVIRVIEIGDVPKKYMDVLTQELNRRGYIHKFVVDRKVPLPQSAYDKYRGQYDAAALLKLARDPKVLLITNADLYSGNLNFVFGMTNGKGPGIVSTARLDPAFYGNQMNFGVTSERLVKESVHEVGHMFGLKNCEDKRCAMAVAQHFSDVDEKGLDFCKQCQVMLASDGTRI
ncbi:MAG: archemetzincin [Candidatus Aenigmatarchaeota archaeon]|nr:MAG: archemetzincin [Candidatus Aenigmarchaeota archaeon]